MTEMPDWYCPSGHPREVQLQRQWDKQTRERRTGGRSMPREPISDEARQAIIEHNRVMKDQREFVAANRHRIDEIWEAIPCPPMTIDEHIAEGKRDPVRWEQLQREWKGEQ